MCLGFLLLHLQSARTTATVIDDITLHRKTADGRRDVSL